MDGEELDHYWVEGYNAGYRRAIEIVKKQSGYGDVDLDRFLEQLVEKMISDWHNG